MRRLQLQSGSPPAAARACGRHDWDPVPPQHSLTTVKGGVQSGDGHTCGKSTATDLHKRNLFLFQKVQHKVSFPNGALCGRVRYSPFGHSALRRQTQRRRRWRWRCRRRQAERRRCGVGVGRPSAVGVGQRPPQRSCVAVAQVGFGVGVGVLGRGAVGFEWCERAACLSCKAPLRLVRIGCRSSGKERRGRP
jgi:hypothetical protein